MGDFGFDANIILSGPRLAQESSEANLNQARLSDMLYQRQRQRSLSDVVSQNAGVYSDPAAQAFARAGFGEQASAAQDQSTQRQFAAQKLVQLHGDILRSQVAAARTPEQYAQLYRRASPQTRDIYGMPEEFDPNWSQTFVASGMKPEEQTTYLQNQRRQAALADQNSPLEQFNKQVLSKFGVTVPPGLNTGDISEQDKGMLEKLAGINAIVAGRQGVAETKAEADAAKAKARAANSGTGALSPEAIDLAVEAAHAGSPITGFGRDKNTQRAIMNAWAIKYPQDNPAFAKANFESNKKSLDHAQTQADSVNSFTRTFDKNVNMLEDAAGKLNSSNSPFVNKGLRWYQSNVEGDPNLTTFKTALNAVTSEAGKINSGSTGAGGVPISVLAEMESNLPTNATPAQIVGALKTLRQDSENRRAAMNEQIGEIKGRLGMKNEQAPSTKASSGGGSLDHDAAATWLRDQANKSSQYYARNLAAYKKAHGGQEP